MTVEFSKVVERHKKVAIVGTGMSLKGVNLEFDDDVAVIAVNSAIEHLDRVDYWFTLDPSPANIETMRKWNRRMGVKYYAAVPDDHVSVSSHVHHLRRLIGNGHGRFRTKGGLSRDKGIIHTGNSAWGAFQAGVHMEPSHVALFGIDGHGDYHFGGAPKVLTMLPFLFASAVEDLGALKIRVVNGSPISTVDCFMKMPPQGAAAWLNEQGR